MLSDNTHDREPATSAGESDNSETSPPRYPSDINRGALCDALDAEELLFGPRQHGDDTGFAQEFYTAASGFDRTWQGAMRLMLESRLLSQEDFSQVSNIDSVRCRPH